MWLGGLLCAALAAFLGSAFAGMPRLPAVVLVWLAGAMAFARVDAATRRLATILLLAGAGATVVATGLGAEFDAVAMGGINLPIIALFLGVAFLGLVEGGDGMPGASEGVQSAAADDARPRAGPSSLWELWRTMGAIHLIGAVINMSMVAIAGDRMARGDSLGRREAILLARSYCAAAFWSPFFVAAAVVHTYAPDARAGIYIPLGILAAACAFALTAREVNTLAADAPLPAFRPDRGALHLTFALLTAVLLLKAALPALPVVVIVAAVTPPLALLLMPRGQPVAALGRLLTTTLPATASQVVLFLAAGVFAYGAANLIPLQLEAVGMLPDSVPLWIHPLVTGGIIAAAYAGMHPVISIAAFSSILVPAGAEPSLLAFAFLAGWAIGTAVAPLSGMNLFLIGRYRLRAREIARWGPGYALRMLAVVAALMLAGHGLLAWRG